MVNIYLIYDLQDKWKWNMERSEEDSYGREKSKYKNILVSKNVPYMFAQEQKGGRGTDKFLILWPVQATFQVLPKEKLPYFS